MLAIATDIAVYVTLYAVGQLEVVSFSKGLFGFTATVEVESTGHPRSFIVQHSSMSLNPEALKSGAHQDYPEYLLQENQLATDENIGLFQAANKGNLVECEKLLKRGAKPNFFFRPEDQKNALHVAAEHGFVDIVKLLLQHGAEVNSVATTDQSSVLTLAAHNDNPALIKILLEHGAAIDHGKLNQLFRI